MSVYDHGLLYGDGVFEGIRVVWRQDLPAHRASGPALRLGQGHLAHHSDAAGGDGRHHRRGGPPVRDRRGVHPPRHYPRRRGTSASIRGSAPSRRCIIIVDTIKLWPEEVYEAGLNVVTAGTPIPQRESLSPAGEVAQLPGPHPGQDRGNPRRRRRSTHAGQRGRGGRGLGPEHLRREGRTASHSTALCRHSQGRHPRRHNGACPAGGYEVRGIDPQPLRRLHRGRSVLHRHRQRGGSHPAGGWTNHRVRQGRAR